MAKRQVYSFVEKKYSTNSIVSAVLSIASVLVLALLLAAAYLLQGQASEWIGAMGLTGIVMAVFGMRYGFAGFKDECKSYFFSKLGTILSTFSIAAWFFIVCIGLVK